MLEIRPQQSIICVCVLAEHEFSTISSIFLRQSVVHRDPPDLVKLVGCLLVFSTVAAVYWKHVSEKENVLLGVR